MAAFYQSIQINSKNGRRHNRDIDAITSLSDEFLSFCNSNFSSRSVVNDRHQSWFTPLSPRVLAFCCSRLFYWNFQRRTRCAAWKIYALYFSFSLSNVGAQPGFINSSRTETGKSFFETKKKKIKRANSRHFKKSKYLKTYNFSSCTYLCLAHRNIHVTKNNSGIKKNIYILSGNHDFLTPIESNNVKTKSYIAPFGRF